MFGWSVQDKSSLICASKNGHLEIVKYLCENGANVNDKDEVCDIYNWFVFHWKYLKWII